MIKKTRCRKKYTGGVSRREFMNSCAVCAASAFIWTIAENSIPVFAQPTSAARKIRVRLIFSHLPPENATWPYKGYNYEGRKKEISNQLQKSCPNIEFIPTTVLEQQYANEIMIFGLCSC